VVVVGWTPEPDDALEREITAALARRGASRVIPPRPVALVGADRVTGWLFGRLLTEDGAWLGLASLFAGTFFDGAQLGGIGRRICARWTERSPDHLAGPVGGGLAEAGHGDASQEVRDGSVQGLGRCPYVRVGALQFGQLGGQTAVVAAHSSHLSPRLFRCVWCAPTTAQPHCTVSPSSVVVWRAPQGGVGVSCPSQYRRRRLLPSIDDRSSAPHVLRRHCADLRQSAGLHGGWWAAPKSTP
jgi:hypothetical protein